ncbi:MAG: glycosyltransferase [Verrucomicrobiota bacterium]
MSTRPPRLALYCHNLWGLGHIARSVRIADAAVELLNADCAIVTGCRCLNASGLKIQDSIHIESLPPAQFDNVGRFFEYGNPDNTQILQQRAEQILTFLREWGADVVIVDNLPLGLGGEMIEALNAATLESWPTRFVWGMPYPECEGKTNRPPRNPKIIRSFERYDLAIAYTEESWLPVFPEYQAYGLPERQDYVGMVAPRLATTPPSEVPLIAVMAGGGRESHVVLEWTVAGLRPQLEDGSLQLRILVGPLGDWERAEHLVEGLRGVELLSEASMDEVINGAHVVVSRMGYNSTFSLLQTEIPLVFVPLPTRDDEQTNRGERVKCLDRIWVIDQRADEADRSLIGALKSALSAPRSPRSLPFSLSGAQQTARWVQRLTQEARDLELEDLRL